MLRLNERTKNTVLFSLRGKIVKLNHVRVGTHWLLWDKIADQIVVELREDERQNYNSIARLDETDNIRPALIPTEIGVAMKRSVASRFELDSVVVVTFEHTMIARRFRRSTASLRIVGVDRAFGEAKPGTQTFAFPMGDPIEIPDLSNK